MRTDVIFAIRDSVGLTIHEAHMLVMFESRNGPDNAGYFGTRETLVRDCNMSLAKAYRVRASLEAKGVLSVTFRGINKSSVYKVTLTEPRDFTCDSDDFSPTETIVSPVENVVSPAENVVSPVENVVSPPYYYKDNNKDNIKDNFKENSIENQALALSSFDDSTVLDPVDPKIAHTVQSSLDSKDSSLSASSHSVASHEDHVAEPQPTAAKSNVIIEETRHLKNGYIEYARKGRSFEQATAAYENGKHITEAWTEEQYNWMIKEYRSHMPPVDDEEW